MNERRATDRRQLLFNARVHDAATGRVLGHLSNLSADGGLMVVSEQPLRVGRAYRVSISLPVDLEGLGAIATDVTVAWSEPALHPAYYRNGLRADALEDKQRAALQRLVNEYDLDIGD